MPLVICLWVLFAGLSIFFRIFPSTCALTLDQSLNTFSGVAKIAFHFTNKVHPIVPECCLLICLGLIVGGMVYAYKDNVRILEFASRIKFTKNGSDWWNWF